MENGTEYLVYSANGYPLLVLLCLYIYTMDVLYSVSWTFLQR